MEHLDKNYMKICVQYQVQIKVFKNTNINLKHLL